MTKLREAIHRVATKVWIASSRSLSSGGASRRGERSHHVTSAAEIDAVIAETLEREARAAGQARRAGWHCTVETAASFTAFYGAVARQGVYFIGARESCCSSRPVTNAHDARSPRSRPLKQLMAKGGN
jgi:hypothetical protein